MAAALPELLEPMAELVVKFYRLMVLRDFNLPSLSPESKVAQEFMVTMATLDSSNLLRFHFIAGYVCATH